MRQVLIFSSTPFNKNGTKLKVCWAWEEEADCMAKQDQQERPGESEDGKPKVKAKKCDVFGVGGGGTWSWEGLCRDAWEEVEKRTKFTRIHESQTW